MEGSGWSIQGPTPGIEWVTGKTYTNEDIMKKLIEIENDVKFTRKWVVSAYYMMMIVITIGFVGLIIRSW